MPIYGYACDTCGHEFELKQGFDAASVQECPRCRNSARRTFHPVGVIYKGSGFYSTDYGKRSGSDSSAESSSSKDDESASNTASSDSDSDSD